MNSLARATAPSMPSLAAASVRAMMYRCRRALRAAATLAAMSCASASFLSLRWPHFLGSSWSSMWTAPAPASSNERTMFITLSASP